MRLLATAPILFLTTTALASGHPTPGLERVCERVAPEATTNEVIYSALEAATGPSCDHHAYFDGKCVSVTRSLAASPTSALAVEVFEITELADGTDGPFYYARGFSLDEFADPSTQPVSVSVNGKPLLDRQVLGEPLEIAGYLRYSKDTGTWSHVVEAHGAKLSFPVTPDSKITEDSATLSVSDIYTVDGATSTLYELTVAKSNDEDDPDGEVFDTQIDLVVTFDEASET